MRAGSAFPASPKIRKKGQSGGFGYPQNRSDSVFDRNPVSGVGFNMFNVQLRDLN